MKTLQEFRALPPLPASELTDGRTVLVIVDMINGFLTEGPLASPRSAQALPACEALLTFARAHDIPVVAFADSHDPDSCEFDSYPLHCLTGTSQSELAPSLQAIGGYALIPKNSTNGAVTSAFRSYFEENPSVGTFVVCGVCTDICVMQFALTLKAMCNELNRPTRVIIPVNAVETYDSPDHNADTLGAAALTFMEQAGIAIAGSIQI